MALWLPHLGGTADENKNRTVTERSSLEMQEILLMKSRPKHILVSAEQKIKLMSTKLKKGEYPENLGIALAQLGIEYRNP